MGVAISRILIVALAITGAVTAAVFAMPDLITVGFFLLILPGLILVITPTIFLYLTVFAIAWFSLHQRETALRIITGLTAIAAVGIGLPQLCNSHTAELLQEAQAKEKPAAAPIAKATIVALQSDPTVTRSGCGDLCQSLLYDSGIQRVVLLPAPKTGPVSFTIQNEKDCPADNPKLLATEYWSQWLTDKERAQIAKTTRLRIATGECLVKDETWNGAPDWVLERVKEDVGTPVKPLNLWPGEVHADGLQLTAHGEVKARQTRLQARRFVVPLHLTPRNGTELRMLGWEWARTGKVEPAVDTRQFLEQSTDTIVAPPVARSEPAKLRRALDAALNDPASTGAAFALVGDYYALFQSATVGQDDARRLARLIADRRVTTFWQLPLHQIASTSDRLLLRDPILDRLPQLAETDNWDSYRALASHIERLPARAFEKPDPRVDGLLADPDRRRAAPALVRRLADRGPGAADRLAEIALEGTKPPPNRHRGTQGDDARAAITGLCRIGPAARAVLPKLRQAAVPPGMQESDLWRAMLISLGARSNEFPLPKNRSGSVDSYRDRLERQAREKCK